MANRDTMDSLLPSLSRRRVAGAACAVLAFVAASFASTPPAAAATWAPAATATVRPGVQTYTEGAQCTANFVFTYQARVFIGQAAHCAGLGAATETDGCLAASHPLGTPVEVTGATRPGTLVYSSWLSMQAAGETDPDTCAYNDFALVELDPADHGRVNPSVPSFGGPTGLGGATTVGERVYTYGNSSLRFGVAVLSPKTGVSLGDDGNGWTHVVYSATPGVPGDSGSGLLNAKGQAIGVLSTVALAPLAGSNNFSDLARTMAYARTHSPFATLALANGTEAFKPSLLGLVPLS
ncbi:MAG: hypothetical protein JWM47_1983 [Acidimicrobiales bacterium]|nr:hypothetical protein [Acidimicrobiales bacterium]